MSYVRKISIDAPLEKVWAAFGSNEELQRWLAPRADVHFAEGEPYELFWDEDPAIDSTLGCRMLRIEPQRLLRFQWQGKDDFMAMFRPPHGPTEVEVRFAHADGVTTLTLEQEETRDLPDWAAYDEWMAGAWEYALGQLAAYCEGGDVS